MSCENVYPSVCCVCVPTGEGVFYGKIDAGLVAGQDVVTFATKLIPYPCYTARFCLCELPVVYVTRCTVSY
jgi:hypothetical protein